MYCVTFFTEFRLIKSPLQYGTHKEERAMKPEQFHEEER